MLMGIPDADLRLPVFPLLAEKSVRGGCAGSPSDTAEMLRFAARHGVKPMIEAFAMEEVDRAIDHVRSGKARYRVVLTV